MGNERGKLLCNEGGGLYCLGSDAVGQLTRDDVFVMNRSRAGAYMCDQRGGG